MELRPYQLQSVEDLRVEYRAGVRRLLLVSPTGSGKTVLFVYVTKGASSRGLRVLILAHRGEILDQISRTMSSWEVPHAVLTAGRTLPMGYQVMVASVQTLCRRLEGSPKPDLVVVDEAHHSCAGSWAQIFAAYPDARYLGVTATPERLDGKGLGDFYHGIVMGPKVGWLISNGFLAKPRYFAPSHLVDVSSIKKTAGDFNKKELGEVMDRPTITGDAVEHYRKFCQGRTAIAFCVSIAHAEHVAEQFKAAGIAAEVIDGTMGREERSAIVERLRARKTMVLVSVDLVSEGFDLPAVGAAILLRPTASLALHLQQVGRVLRPAEGKSDALILDHVGNCARHGLAEEDRPWSLDGHTAKKRTKEKALETRQCEKCFAIFWGPKCPECGTVREIQTRELEQTDGQLQEISAARLADIRNRKAEERMCRTLEDFRKLASIRGYKQGWAYYRWKTSWKSKVPNENGKQSPIGGSTGGRFDPNGSRVSEPSRSGLCRAGG